MCLEAAKSIPTGELLAYKLIARRKEDGGLCKSYTEVSCLEY